jgi:hypothetical protein
MESKSSSRGRFESEDEYDVKASKAVSDAHSQAKEIPVASSGHLAESKVVSNGAAPSGSKSTGGGSAKLTSLDAGFKHEKSVLDEIQQDMEADEEFERLKNKLAMPTCDVGRSALARNFVRGFRM